MEATVPRKGVVMETLIGELAIGFWKLIKASVDGEKEVKKEEEKYKVRHRRPSGVTWSQIGERTRHYHKTEHDRFQRPICPARMPKSECARISLLWRFSAHDSACRTMG